VPGVALLEPYLRLTPAMKQDRIRIERAEPGSEMDVAHRHGIEFRADIGSRDRGSLLGDSKRVDGLASAGDAIGRRELIVEVDLAHASGDFPRTQPPSSSESGCAGLTPF
jgi:hypothetical protein